MTAIFSAFSVKSAHSAIPYTRRALREIRDSHKVYAKTLHTLDTTPNFCENSGMPRKNKILNIGDTAPSFSLPSHRRQVVSLEAFRDVQHVVLTFFRGTW